MDQIDILVVGGGGREHALAWKLRQSPRCGRLFSAPGNAGIRGVAECVPIPVGDLDRLVQFARENAIGLVVVGPEAPLAAGLADRLAESGILVFGPSAAAARIESSKAYARDLMARMGVPQPAFARFREAEPALAFLNDLAARGATAAVVKASGLAAGKGSIVCDNLDQARTAVRDMLVDRSFGAAGAEIVIEERISGPEASLLVLTDGERVLPLPPAQDYKRAFDNDRSLWAGDYEILTGGMGCYAPAPVITPELLQDALDRIVRPTLRGLREDGTPFRGCLYAGLMLTASGLQVIEFNCRFGDPETQVVLPLLDADLVELFLAVARGELSEAAVPWKTGAEGRAVTVVMASGGYPGDYETGKEITGLDAAAGLPGVTVFHAGTADRDGSTVTAGGRVLSVTGAGGSFAEATDRAYAGVRAIAFDQAHYRTDIAARVREA